jgi:hypothetical protein
LMQLLADDGRARDESTNGDVKPSTEIEELAIRRAGA